MATLRIGRSKSAAARLCVLSHLLPIRVQEAADAAEAAGTPLTRKQEAALRAQEAHFMTLHEGFISTCAGPSHSQPMCTRCYKHLPVRRMMNSTVPNPVVYGSQAVGIQA